MVTCFKKLGKIPFKQLLNSVFTKFFQWLFLISLLMINCEFVAKIAKFTPKSHILALENHFEKNIHLKFCNEICGFLMKSQI